MIGSRLTSTHLYNLWSERSQKTTLSLHEGRLSIWRDVNRAPPKCGTCECRYLTPKLLRVLAPLYSWRLRLTAPTTPVHVANKLSTFPTPTSALAPSPSRPRYYYDQRRETESENPPRETYREASVAAVTMDAPEPDTPFAAVTAETSKLGRVRGILFDGEEGGLRWLAMGGLGRTGFEGRRTGFEERSTADSRL